MNSATDIITEEKMETDSLYNLMFLNQQTRLETDEFRAV